MARTKGFSSTSDKDFDAAVGRRILKLRLAANLTQADLAAAIGLSFQQIHKYETGVNRVAASRLAAIAARLGVPMWLLFADPEQDAETAARVALWREGTAPGAEALVDLFLRCSQDDRNLILSMAERLAN